MLVWFACILVAHAIHTCIYVEPSPSPELWKRPFGTRCAGHGVRCLAEGKDRKGVGLGRFWMLQTGFQLQVQSAGH